LFSLWFICLFYHKKNGHIWPFWLILVSRRSHLRPRGIFFKDVCHFKHSLIFKLRGKNLNSYGEGFFLCIFALSKSCGDRDSWDSGKACGDGIGIWEVHFDRIINLVSKFPSNVWTYGAHDHIDLFKSFGKVFTNKRSDLSGFFVIRIIKTSRKDIASKDDSSLCFHTKSFSTVVFVHFVHILVVFVAFMPITDSIKSSKVGRNLRRHKDIIRSNGILSHWEWDFFDFGSEFFHRFDRFHDGGSHSLIESSFKVFFWNTYFDSFKIIFFPDFWVNEVFSIERSVFSFIKSIHDFIEKSRIFDAFGEGSWTIKAWCHRDDSKTRISSIAWLESYDSTHTRRLSDTSSGVGSKSSGAESCSNCCGTSSTWTSRDTVISPRIYGLLKGRRFGTRSHRKFVHIEFSDARHSRIFEVWDDGGIVGRHEVGKHFRATSSGDSDFTKNIFDPNRGSCQRERGIFAESFGMEAVECFYFWVILFNTTKEILPDLFWSGFSRFDESNDFFKTQFFHTFRD